MWFDDIRYAIYCSIVYKLHFDMARGRSEVGNSYMWFDDIKYAIYCSIVCKLHFDMTRGRSEVEKGLLVIVFGYYYNWAIVLGTRAYEYFIFFFFYM